MILGRYPVLRHLTLNLTLKVKCQDKGHGYVSWPGRLAITKDDLGIRVRADAILGGYQVLRPFDPEFDPKGQKPNQRSRLCKLPREASYHLGRF